MTRTTEAAKALAARELLLEFWHHAQYGRSETRAAWIDKCEPILTDALHAAEQRVWEMIIHELQSRRHL
jgi:hypothetical protein